MVNGFQGKLLVLLVIAVCVVPPRPINGLSCLSCTTEQRSADSDPSCGKEDPKKTQKCSEDEIACSFMVEADERYVMRQCISDRYISCAKDIFNMTLEDGKCFKKEGLTGKKWEAFNDCESDKAVKSVQGGEPAAAQESDAPPPGGPVQGDPSKRALQNGPGSRNDITKMELCICKSDNCNTNAIKPRTVNELDDDSGVGMIQSSLLITVLVSGLGWIQSI